jgi:hypothetical protein
MRKSLSRDRSPSTVPVPPAEYHRSVSLNGGCGASATKRFLEVFAAPGLDGLNVLSPDLSGE